MMYVISATAFLIYLCRIPERWMAGKVDFFGHSHNWWHFFVLVALYYWHNTGKYYFLNDIKIQTTRTMCAFDLFDDVDSFTFITILYNATFTVVVDLCMCLRPTYPLIIPPTK